MKAFFSNLSAKTLFVLRLVPTLIPRRLPQGMTESKAWSDSIVKAAGVPDNDSFRFAIAAMILQLGPLKAFKSKFYFVLALWKGAANQIAGGVMHELKQKQDEANKAAKAAEEASVKAANSTPGAAATALSLVADVKPPIQN